MPGQTMTVRAERPRGDVTPEVEVSSPAAIEALERMLTKAKRKAIAGPPAS